MSVAVKMTPEPPVAVSGPLLARAYRFTVEQYQRMIDAGVFRPDDRAELLEGWVIRKMTHHPPHAVALDLARAALQVLLPAEWLLREQKPINTAESRPEPDFVIVPSPIRRYAKQHPEPRDVALVVEVADATLTEDRIDKARIYARARIPVYWIINVAHGQVEVYTQPRAGKAPGYRERRDYGKGESVPLAIAGRELGSVAVNDLLP